jgi:hypothetical protein
MSQSQRVCSPPASEGRKSEKRIPLLPEAAHTSIMLDDRRNRVPGGTFFFIANPLDRRAHLLMTQIDALL